VPVKLEEGRKKRKKKESEREIMLSEFFFPNSVLLCSFLGLWPAGSGFTNPPLQSLVNQLEYFSKIFERLFSKKKH